MIICPKQPPVMLRDRGSFAGKRTLAIAALLFAHPPSAADGETLYKSLIHVGRDGVAYSRTYNVYMPCTYVPGYGTPLIVNVHGSGWNGAAQARRSGMDVVSEQNGFLVVYPEAINGAWGSPDLSDRYDDMGFIIHVLNEVSSEYSVDPARVYVTGFSAGGGISYILTVLNPYIFAAMASVGACRQYETGTTIPYPAWAPQLPCRPFPLLDIHGTADVIEPYGGGCGAWGMCYPAVEQWVGQWALNNGCNATPTVTNLPDMDLTDGCAFLGPCGISSTVQLLTYDSCGTYVDRVGNARTAEILLYKVEGGGHSWPADFVTDYATHNLPVNHDINASTEIWNFFSRHSVAVAWADLDSDLDVDASDYARFDSCAAGPAAYHPACTLTPDSEGIVRADADRDGDVDQEDFGLFQRCFSGQGRRPDRECAR